MSGNKVSPSQPEKNIEEVRGSPSDQEGRPTYKHGGEQRPKVGPTVKRDTTKWILKNINANAGLCNEESEEKNMCHCGKNQEKHVSNDEMQQNKSDTERTNYFGEITFDSNHTAKYIRVHSKTTKPKTVLELMNEKWKLEIPDLLISVRGSMKSSDNASVAKTCQTGLTKAVQGIGAWIITDGEQKYVNTDETSHEQPIIIGISQWGAIHNKHQKDNQQGTRPAETCTKKTSLDRHHSHFILIDEGSGDKSFTTSNFRKEFESEITKIKSDNGVPIFLVLQGDEERNIPAVIVKTSDLKASGKEKQSHIPEDISTPKPTHTCEWNVHSCDSDLGCAIFQALLKDAENKETMEKITYHKYHLKLFEIANNISIDTIWRQEDILKTCMMAAILLDKVEYVKLILDNEFDLKTFLTYEKLKELYNAQFEGSLFNDVLPKMTKPLDTDKETNVWKHVERLLNHVRESKPQLRYLDDIIMVENCCTKTCCTKEGCCCLRIACCTSTKNRKSSDKHAAKKQSVDEHAANKQSVDENPFLDLFVWSVLNNRQDMAKLFWQRGKDAMAAALFAHALLSAMSQQIDDTDFKEKCEKNSREFTNLAIGILKECHKENVNLGNRLLFIEQGQWANTSCVKIAVNAKNEQFISDQACQDVFNNIWMGKIDQETGSLRNNLKLLLCIFLPFLILCLVPFKKKPQKKKYQKKKHQKKHQTCDDPETSIGPEIDPSSTHPHQKKKAKGQEPTIWKKIKYFYQAPVIICFHYVISYIIFLGLYSYILMSEVNRYLTWREIVLCVWVFTILTHEVMQVWSKNSRSQWNEYIKDGWNILDIVMLVLFLFGMILRIFDHPQVAEFAHIVLGVNLITFYLRLLQILSVHRELGPKLVMIIHMVKNMAYFFMIIVVFVVAYGIVSHSILFPHTEPSLETFIEIFRRPYWNIYGELMLDTFEGSADCTNDPELYKTGSYSRCPTESGKYFVPLLMGVYMLMCNILLLNLLIAMFSFTFEKVQDKSHTYWSFQQYSLIEEYANRTCLVPPASICVHLYKIIKLLMCCKAKQYKKNKYLRTVEAEMAEKVYNNGMQHNSPNVSDIDSANLEKRLEQIEEKLNWLVQTQKENNRRAKVE